MVVPRNAPPAGRPIEVPDTESDGEDFVITAGETDLAVVDVAALDLYTRECFLCVPEIADCLRGVAVKESAGLAACSGRRSGMRGDGPARTNGWLSGQGQCGHTAAAVAATKRHGRLGAVAAVAAMAPPPRRLWQPWRCGNGAF
jgi:hypothetical protein